MSYYLQSMGFGRKTGSHTVKLTAGKLTTEATEALKRYPAPWRSLVYREAKTIAAERNRAYVTVAMLREANERLGK